jgi:hypothetical protein
MDILFLLNNDGHPLSIPFASFLQVGRSFIWSMIPNMVSLFIKKIDPNSKQLYSVVLIALNTQSL